MMFERMKKTFVNGPWITSVGCALVLGAVGSAHGAVVFSDDFSEADGTLIPGSNENPGKSADVPASATWAANVGSQPTVVGGVATINNNPNIGFAVSAWTLNLPITPTATDNIVRFSGAINPAGTQFVDASLYNDTDGTPNWFDNTQIGIRFLKGATNDTWALRANDVAGDLDFLDLGSGTVPTGQLHTFVIEYNDTTNSANLTINGTQVVTNVSLGAFNPTFDSLGFTFQNPGGSNLGTNQMAVDDLEVQIVPEPASIGLMACGLILISRRGRRNDR